MHAVVQGRVVARIAKTMALELGVSESLQAGISLAGLLTGLVELTSSKSVYAWLSSDSGTKFLAKCLPDVRLTKPIVDAVCYALFWLQDYDGIPCAELTASEVTGFRDFVAAAGLPWVLVDTGVKKFVAPDYGVQAKYDVVLTCVSAAYRAARDLDTTAAARISDGASLVLFPEIDSLFHRGFKQSSVVTGLAPEVQACVVAQSALIQLGCQPEFGVRAGLYRGLARGRKTVFVCPRNSVARHAYDLVTAELAVLGSQRSAELYTTSARQASTDSSVLEFGSDFVVTNVDMLLRSQVDLDASARRWSVLSSDIVFVDYHEYTSTDSVLLAAFVTWLQQRLECGNTNTLGTSELPMNIFGHVGKTVWLPGPPSEPTGIDLRLSTGTPAGVPVDRNQLTVLHSIRNAQAHFLRSPENCVLVHSKFTKSDRNARRAALRGTVVSVVSAPSVHNDAVCEFTSAFVSSGTPEADLRAAARLADTGVLHLCSMLEDPGERAVLRMLNTKNVHGAWFDFLTGRFNEQSIVTYADLLAAYHDFYSTHSDMLRQHLVDTLAYGMAGLPRLAPVFVPKPETRRKTPVGTKSYRSPGGSYYVKVRRTTGTWLSKDDVISLAPDEFRRLASAEPWLMNTSKRTKLARELGKTYGFLHGYTGNKFEFARYPETGFPLLEWVYDSRLGLVPA